MTMNDKIFSASNWERLLSPEREARMSYKTFLERVEPQPNERWADIGCGPGYFTIPLAQNAAHVFAEDISDDMLHICKKRAAENSIQNISFVKSKDDDIPLEDDAVDKALLANVFHEFENRVHVVDELHRILRMDGQVFIIDWKYKAMEMGPPLEHRIPKGDVIRDFTDRGFRLVHDWDIYEFNYVLGFKKTKEL